ncbi:hypothetical protein CXG81DRAFT_28458 [Caulochytrium protostelioides]|uniref:SH3 domain-containing protein n=1 Tax=Caulochytrium protostelioides TaxID=1555241 RepID=A0A4P9X1J2_9FUNG|nr:hypothetical protein CXG81DRAFT_28458 [Caulochytrium protostelioides]|eukprot:RKO98738.1 hypothetical protein CXG81DRAFT_28458 [Caulochytrium protostelioides]
MLLGIVVAAVLLGAPRPGAARPMPPVAAAAAAAAEADAAPAARLADLDLAFHRVALDASTAPALLTAASSAPAWPSRPPPPLARWSVTNPGGHAVPRRRPPAPASPRSGLQPVPRRQDRGPDTDEASDRRDRLLATRAVRVWAALSGIATVGLVAALTMGCAVARRRRRDRFRADGKPVPAPRGGRRRAAAGAATTSPQAAGASDAVVAGAWVRAAQGATVVESEVLLVEAAAATALTAAPTDRDEPADAPPGLPPRPRSSHRLRSTLSPPRRTLHATSREASPAASSSSAPPSSSSLSSLPVSSSSVVAAMAAERRAAPDAATGRLRASLPPAGAALDPFAPAGAASPASNATTKRKSHDGAPTPAGRRTSAWTILFNRRLTHPGREAPLNERAATGGPAGTAAAAAAAAAVAATSGAATTITTITTTTTTTTAAAAAAATTTMVGAAAAAAATGAALPPQSRPPHRPAAASPGVHADRGSSEVARHDRGADAADAAEKGKAPMVGRRALRMPPPSPPPSPTPPLPPPLPTRSAAAAFFARARAQIIRRTHRGTPASRPADPQRRVSRPKDAYGVLQFKDKDLNHVAKGQAVRRIRQTSRRLSAHSLAPSLASLSASSVTTAASVASVASVASGASAATTTATATATAMAMATATAPGRRWPRWRPGGAPSIPPRGGGGPSDWRPPQPVPAVFRAVHRFTGRHPDELDVAPGDAGLALRFYDDGWVLVRRMVRGGTSEAAWAASAWAAAATTTTATTATATAPPAASQILQRRPFWGAWAKRSTPAASAAPSARLRIRTPPPSPLARTVATAGGPPAADGSESSDDDDHDNHDDAVEDGSDGGLSDDDDDDATVVVVAAAPDAASVPASDDAGDKPTACSSGKRSRAVAPSVAPPAPTPPMTMPPVPAPNRRRGIGYVPLAFLAIVPSSANPV